MLILSEWPVQGAEAATPETSPRRARGHCPYSSLDVTQGNVVVRESERVQGVRIPEVCASLNRMHVI